MKPLLLRLLPYLAAVLLVAGALFGAYHHGLSVRDAEWQSAWNARDTRDARARDDNEAAERSKEQARQLSVNKAIQDGQQIIGQANADAAAASASADSLRGAADALAARLAASEVSGNCALPPQARQLPAPPFCLPTCSNALTSERVIRLKPLTRPEQGV